MNVSPRVSLAEIADYARVRRPTVSNWRRRHADFPPPAGGTAAAPVFDAAQVAAWLDRRPVPDTASAADLPGGPGESAQTYGDLFRTGLLLAAVTSVPDIPPDRLLPEALRLIADGDGGPQQADPASAGLAQAVAALVAAAGPTRAAERLLGAAGRMGADWAATRTPPATSVLVAELHRVLADGAAGQSVLDLCAGTGDMLAALPAAGAPAAVTAVEPEAPLRELLALRLRCHGVADPRIADRPPDSGAADAVLADPPFHSGEHADHPGHPLLWAEQAVARLGMDGIGYVVVPDWALTHAGRGGAAPPVARSREFLLRGRCLRAVVQLPRRVHPARPGAELVLLVLAAEGSGDGSVVLCDADRIAQRHGRRLRGDTGDGAWIGPWAAEVARAIGAVGTGPAADACQAVPLRELLPPRRRSLPLPSQHLTAPAEPAERVGDAAEARRAAAASLADTQGPARRWLDRLHVTERRTPIRHERLGALLRGGQLRLLPGHRIRAKDLGGHGQRVYGREEMLGELPLGRRRIDPLVLASYTSAVVTEPGDVVLIFEERLRAVVDEGGGSVLLAPVQGLRIPAYGELRGPMAASLGRGSAMRIWPHQLAAVLNAGRNARRGQGSLVRRADLEGVEIPDLSPQEARLFNEAMAEHSAQVQHLRRQLAAMEELGSALVSGTADGALSVQMRPAASAPDGHRAAER